MSIFNDKSLKNVADIAAKIMEAQATTPKTDKEKSLAALGHPKDKITHKDVLIGRGVLKKEETEKIDEGWKEMMAATKAKAGPQPSGGSGVKLGTRYGGGRQKDEGEEEKTPRQKYGARQKRKVTESFTELLQKYDQEGLKAFVPLEEEPDTEQYTKELKDQIASMSGKKKQPSVATPSTQGVKEMPEQVEVFDADKINGTTVETIDEGRNSDADAERVQRKVENVKKPSASVSYKDPEKGWIGQSKDYYKKVEAARKGQLKKEDVEQIEERKLTEPETAKKEEVVKSMKKNLPGFKQRYGERAKSVMYATATKIAKKD